MNTTVTYFAYGSNMKAERVRRRAPSARAIGRARLLHKCMMCNKQGDDGSGKANLVDSPGAVVWGVLYKLAPLELAELDQAEGGYQRVTLTALGEQGEPVEAEVYVSTTLTADSTPYDWYRDLIVQGALEHGLPEDYVERLTRLVAKPDPHRSKRNSL